MPCALNQRATARAPSSSKGRTSAPVKSSRPPTPLTRCARDDPGGLHPEVGVAVAVGHRLAGDLEHRLVALGGDVAQGVDLALEQLVGGHRGAVADRADRVAVTLRKPEQPEHLVDAGHEPVGRVARRRGRLGGDQLAGVLVEGDDVGEGAAGVDADADPAGHATSLAGGVGTERRQHLPKRLGPRLLPSGRGPVRDRARHRPARPHVRVVRRRARRRPGRPRGGGPGAGGHGGSGVGAGREVRRGLPRPGRPRQEGRPVPVRVLGRPGRWDSTTGSAAAS